MHPNDYSNNHTNSPGVGTSAVWSCLCTGCATCARCPAPPVKAEEDLGAQNTPAADEITADMDSSVRRGLESLASQQNADGSFGRGRYGKHVGITALCALAFMADGHLPDRGKYGLEVRRALDFVLENATETGMLAAETSHGPMYGHGFATLFLGEIYGMNPSDERVRDALGRAIQLIVNSQNDEGGWRYNPVPYDADISVTICEIMALRSARNAGIKIPRSTIDKAVEYVRACQNSDGGFRYMAQSGGSAWPRTAAGVASLFYAGIYEDEAIEKGLDFPGAHRDARSRGFWTCALLLRSLLRGTGDVPCWWRMWDRWWPAIREELIQRQSTDGSWHDHQIGQSYATAMALIVMQMPKRYLPIFQK